jgi:hypothetical protein
MRQNLPPRNQLTRIRLHFSYSCYRPIGIITQETRLSTQQHSYKYVGTGTGWQRSHHFVGVTTQTFYLRLRARSRCHIRTAAFTFIVQSCDEDDYIFRFYRVMKHRLNYPDREKTEVLGVNTCLSATLSSTNPTRPPPWRGRLTARGMARPTHTHLVPSIAEHNRVLNIHIRREPYRHLITHIYHFKGYHSVVFLITELKIESV